MNFSRDTKGDIVIEKINLKRATAAEAEEFKSILLKEIEEGWRKIIIDFSDNTFMDSSFLGSVVIALRTISKLGGDLRIAGAKGDTKNILDITGAYRVFLSFDSTEDAVLSFRNNKKFN